MQSSTKELNKTLHLEKITIINPPPPPNNPAIIAITNNNPIKDLNNSITKAIIMRATNATTVASTGTTKSIKADSHVLSHSPVIMPMIPGKNHKSASPEIS